MRWIGLGACFAVLAVSFGIFASFGTGDLLQPTLATPYDSLAKSLMRGEVGVPDGAVAYENIRVNGKNVIYFGAFPAMLRMPLLVVFPWTFGELAPLLNWLGGLFCAGALYVMFREATRRAKLSGRWAVALALVFSLGSPVLYLVAVPTVYQEAILWALGFSLWTIAIAYRALRTGWSIGTLFLLSLTTAGAMLSRLTFAVPLVAILGVVFLLTSWTRREWLLSAKMIGALALGLLPMVLGGLFLLWYNHARFGSPLTFLTWVGYEMESEFAAKKRAELGSFNARRVPFSFGEYLGVHADYVTPAFPWLSPWTPARPTRPDLYFSDGSEAMIPLTMASPVLILFSLLGLASLVRTRSPALIFASACFLVQVALICAWYFITYRYTAEFVPMLAVLTLAALEGPFWPKRRATVSALLAVSVLSVAMTWVSTARLVIHQTGIADPFRQYLIRTIGTGR
ncbi:MAG: hypothetical protein SFU53_08925 [Terrimicrobiaceae bacterium]|nr:hypothetical protein [Terrimicrobiaceae bacterium]